MISFTRNALKRNVFSQNQSKRVKQLFPNWEVPLLATRKVGSDKSNYRSRLYCHAFAFHGFHSWMAAHQPVKTMTYSHCLYILCLHSKDVLKPTSLCQLFHHLLSQFLHVWITVCCNGHLAELPQCVHTAVLLQVVI